MKNLINQHNFDVEGVLGGLGGLLGVSTNIFSMFRQPYPSAWPAMPRAPRTGQLQRLAKLEMLPMFLSMVIVNRHIQDSYSINANQNTKYAISIKCQCAEIDNMSIWLLNIDLHAARQFLVANLCTFWWTFYWQKKVVAYKKINIRYVWRCQS